MTQDEFARLLGVNYTSVSRWENGSFEPTIKMKKKLHELFTETKIVEEQ